MKKSHGISSLLGKTGKNEYSAPKIWKRLICLVMIFEGKLANLLKTAKYYETRTALMPDEN